MSKPIASPRAIPADGSPSSAGVPNIPPRSTQTPVNAPAPHSLSTSLRPTSPTSPFRPRTEPSSRASNENLIGRKTSPTSRPYSSALTASLGTSPRSPTDALGSPAAPPATRKPSVSFRPSPVRDDSETSATRADESFSNLADVPDAEKAKVLRRHLVSATERRASTPGGTPAEITPARSPVDSGFTRTLSDRRESTTPGGSGVNGYGSTSESPKPVDDRFPIPYDAHGGDVTHDLYKWQHDHRPNKPGRSVSFSHVPLDRSAILDPTLAHIKEPGGFRRNFIVNRAQEQGLEPPSVLRNVVDFLFLYGHFAGEDLHEDEDVDSEEEEDETPTLGQAENGHSNHVQQRSGRKSLRSVSGERAPLLGQSGRGMSMTRHRRTKSGPHQGTATVTQATLMLLKGFVGTGILFMAKAFFNGGILFSAVVLVSIAAISLWAFLLLTSTYLVVPGSFGDIGGQLYGNWLRITILTSIAVSQIGFVAAYTIFIAENLQAFTMAVTDCRTFIPIRYLIFAELIVFMPLAMIRNLAKLSGTALIADAFILIGLIYIGANESIVIAKKGVADVMLFNKDSFSLLIGTAVFAFEGIGLVIPLTEAMREPRKFPKVLAGVMSIVAVLFAGFGVLGYAAYGSNIQTVVIVNLPQDDKFVQAVQFLYSIAILLSIPLQLFPAVRIMETGLFSKSGKHDPSVKWQKNVFRAGTVVFCSLISWAGSNELDKFVALVGAFACIPLCFIYPPLLHLKAVAKTRTARTLDYLLLVFGIIVGVYTTAQTVRSLFEPGGEAPRFGKCEVPKDA